ncbi:MAG TPA: thiamine pyrophosphate-binding protein [Mucilaginibacter sp.]|jgi:acetolactate synthase-1/2/3 large subunit|nr:thiamine pyrophosphate-binding protein [Mucilaginibacter sp.]
MKKKVSDIVIDYIVEKGIDHVFMVTGGGIMHLTDSIGTNLNLSYTCNNHEQASVIAAESYARIKNKPGVALVTIGPGAGNAIAGVFGAWYDSIPLIIISGQVRSDIIADYSLIRQKGAQEANIIETVKPITKYAVSVTNPDDIFDEIEKAYGLATSGRPGPVWIEIPTNIQGTIIEFEEKDNSKKAKALPTITEEQVKEICDLISQSKRPLFVPGNGINLAGARDEWFKLFNNIEIPAVVSVLSKDLIIDEHPRSVGAFGTSGQRRANFAVQNCDCLIAIGAGLSIAKVGFNFDNFAPKAKKIIVDIDINQIRYQPIKADLEVVCDAGEFIKLIGKELSSRQLNTDKRWLDACKNWKDKYPIILEDYYQDKNHVNMYVFMDKLSDYLTGGEVIISGNGFDCVSLYQAFKVKNNQRIVVGGGNWGSMGWDLPLCIGAKVANPAANVICVTGDGSFQFNVQELLTMKQYKLPIKIFIYNNAGYASIRSTQNSLMEGRIYASDDKSGVGTPDFKKLAEAYSFGYEQINTNDDLGKIEQLLHSDEPFICEVKIAYDVIITPKASAFKREDGTLESRPLEDMFPFLPREEIKYNMTLFED